MSTQQKPRVIIVGGGFGGIYAARELSNKAVDVLLIDRNNFHTFTPLLYQVATSGLEPEEIAYPIRGVFRYSSNFQFLLGEVVAIDTATQSVEVKTNGTTRHERYDYLIVAGGSTTNYFGMNGAQQHGFGLKSLDDAVALRNHILTMYERAAWIDDERQREELTTMVVIGGGPTGLETVGALYELYTHVLRKEYAFLANTKVRVVLIEATDRLLAPFPENLQQAALDQLHSLNVEVILNNGVREVTANSVELLDGTVIPTRTLVWAAGVKASPRLSDMLGVELAWGGRVPIQPTTETVEKPNVFVVGDMAYLEDKSGSPYPMLIPVAKQQGILAARNILRRIAGEADETFRYIDRGIMATIGRRRAVAWIYYRLQLRGFIAWVSWLGLHLIMLMGFRNRLNVFINWAWNYVTYDRSVRIILGDRETQPEHESL